MNILGEKVNAHLPWYSTLKSFGIFSSKTFRAGMLFSGEEEHSISKRLEENIPELFSVLY